MLPGATVTLKAAAGFSRSVITDPKGAFTFADVPPGPATLTVALLRAYPRRSAAGIPARIRFHSVEYAGK